MRLRPSLTAAGAVWVTWALRLNRLFLLGTQADEGVHVTVAEQLAQGNAALYEDLFENRTPGVESLLSALFRLAEADLLLARLVAAGMACLTVAALYALAREVTDRTNGSSAAGIASGLLAGLLFATAPLAILWGRFTMLEHFTAAASAISVALAIMGLHRETERYWFAGGLAAGLAVLFKQSALILLPVMGSFFLLHAFVAARKGTGRRAALWGAGFGLPLALFVGCLLVQGTLDAFVQSLSGAGQLAPLANWQNKATVVLDWSVKRPLVPLALIAGFAALWQCRSSGPLLVLLWWLAETGALFLPARLDLQPGGFSHYAIPALAAGAAVASLGLALLWRSLLETRAGRFLNPARVLGTALALGALLLTAPGWARDAREAWLHTEYPQPNMEQELAIGRAASLVTEPSEPVVVLANAIFYHWAQRKPAARFFHWPEYVRDSELAGEAGGDVARALADPEAGAVLLSRMHMEERITPVVEAALWRSWVPAALFPYPYQRDVVVFLPRPGPLAGSSALAKFGGHFALLQVNAELLDTDNLLVGLRWRALAPAEENYSVFAHLLDEEGALLAQADSEPMVGFRPTTSWQAADVVVDYHWIRLPPSMDITDARLSVGLYLPQTGERLLRDKPAGVAGEAGDGADSYEHPLHSLLR